MASLGSQPPTPRPARSNTVFLLTVSLFASAILAATIGLATDTVSVPGGQATVQYSVVLYAILGLIGLGHWLRDRPEYGAGRPLGIGLLTIETGLTAAILLIYAIVLLLLPILGIIGVTVGAIGLGFAIEAKGLWEGTKWSLTILLILAILQIVGGIAALAFYRVGPPILGVYQLWYLRQPRLRMYFRE